MRACQYEALIARHERASRRYAEMIGKECAPRRSERRVRSAMAPADEAFRKMRERGDARRCTRSDGARENDSAALLCRMPALMRTVRDAMVRADICSDVRGAAVAARAMLC